MELGPKNHVWYGFWDLMPYWKSEWTLWVTMLETSKLKLPSFTSRSSCNKPAAVRKYIGWSGLQLCVVVLTWPPGIQEELGNACAHASSGKGPCYSTVHCIAADPCCSAFKVPDGIDLFHSSCGGWVFESSPTVRIIWPLWGWVGRAGESPRSSRAALCQQLSSKPLPTIHATHPSFGPRGLESKGTIGFLKDPNEP